MLHLKKMCKASPASSLPKPCWDVPTIAISSGHQPGERIICCHKKVALLHPKTPSKTSQGLEVCCHPKVKSYAYP